MPSNRKIYLVDKDCLRDFLKDHGGKLFKQLSKIGIPSKYIFSSDGLNRYPYSNAEKFKNGQWYTEAIKSTANCSKDQTDPV